MAAGTALLCSTLMFVHVFVSTEQSIIIAEPGQDVILTCRAPNNNIRVVKWSRADLGDDYVLLYQDGQFDPDDQHPSFKNRVDLQDRRMKDGDVSLILKDVTINDAGTYECHVFMEKAQSWEHTIIYLVVDPPEQSIITSESGQDVILTCRAPNNNIRVVKWNRADLGDDYLLLYQDGKFDPDHQHPSFKNRVNLQDRQMKDGDVSVILKDVMINDAGTYVCQLFMEKTQSWEHTIIHLVVDPLVQKTITAESGQDVTLTCQAPSNNIRVVQWNRADLGNDYVFLYHSGHFLLDNQHPSFKNRVNLQDRQMKDGDVSLILKDVKINDIGTYVCQVFMEETLSWKFISISLVVVPPEQSIITSESGQDVILPCRARNNNIKILNWIRKDLGDENVLVYRDAHFITDNQHPSFKNRVNLQDRQMKDGDVSLILKDVTINDTGTYVCGVFSVGEQSWETISIYLRVVPPGQTGGERDEL